MQLEELNTSIILCDEAKPCLWVPVTTVRSVLRLRMEERGPILWVAANKLNKKLRTGDKGWSSSFGFGQGTNNSSPLKPNFFEYSQARCVLWRQNNPEVNYSPNRISGGEGGVFVEEASPNRKRKSEILWVTWNVHCRLWCFTDEWRKENIKIINMKIYVYNLSSPILHDDFFLQS